VKKSVALMMLLSFLLVSLVGCATESYVKQQITPLADRINKLEATSATQDSVNSVKQQTDNLANRISKVEADVEKAKSDAAEALQIAKDYRNKSEAAAERAENAAKKAEKAFELHQRK